MFKATELHIVSNDQKICTLAPPRVPALTPHSNLETGPQFRPGDVTVLGLVLVEL